MNNPKSDRLFKITTLVTAITNVPYILVFIWGQVSPLTQGAEGFYMLIPIIFVGWAYAAFYLFYFPYYAIKYKQKNGIVLLGAVTFAAIVLVILLMFLRVISVA